MKKLLFVLFAFFGIGLFLQNNTYADSPDFVFNIDSNSTFPLTLCSNPATNDYPVCHSYTFIKVEPVYAVTPTTPNNSYFSISGLYGTRVPTFVDSYYEINNFVTGLSISSWSSNLSSLKITFTNSISSACPEPPEPDCPDPEENSQYMNVVLDSFWKYQKAFAGAVVAIIVIFIVYRLIKGILR